MRDKTLKVLSAGVLFVASTLGHTYGLEKPPEEPPVYKLPLEETLEKLEKFKPEFVGDRIPERNIPEERMKELKAEMKLRSVQLKAEREQKRLEEENRRLQEELERLKKAEADRIAQEKAEAQRQAAQQQTQEKQQRSVSEAVGEFTAYYPYNDAMQGGGITATGYNLYNSIYYDGMRVIASDSSIPFYSILEFSIEGYGTFRGIVLDRGGRIKGNKFDIAFPDKESCMEFGRRSGTYKIIRYGKG